MASRPGEDAIGDFGVDGVEGPVECVEEVEGEEGGLLKASFCRRRYRLHSMGRLRMASR